MKGVLQAKMCLYVNTRLKVPADNGSQRTTCRTLQSQQEHTHLGRRYQNTVRSPETAVIHPSVNFLLPGSVCHILLQNPMISMFCCSSKSTTVLQPVPDQHEVTQTNM